MTIGISVLDAATTASLLPFDQLVEDIALAAQEHANGLISAPARQAVPYPGTGVMLSMPATAADIGLHKLVNVQPGNRHLHLPTIHGIVAVYGADDGRPRLLLDGPTVTARRTAAVSMLALRTLSVQPVSEAAIIGTGVEATSHAQALAATHPGIRLTMIGSSLEKAQHFVQAQHDLPLDLCMATSVPPQAQLVITATTSATPVYDEPARAGRLVIGVGAYRPELAEIGAQTLEASRLYVDELEGARHEAGDYLQAGVDWNRVTPLAQALQEMADPSQPAVFKSVGCAAWDLAAARCALRRHGA